MESQPDIARMVSETAHEIADHVRSIREDIHAHPETRYREFRTASLVADELEALGIEVRRGVGETGVVGLLRGGRAGATIGFRAEMDALPMEDLCGQPFQSKNPGAAHLCGHDGHVAALLGTARALAGLRKHLAGNVKFFFEPAEEATPEGELHGSQAMIRDGALDDPAPSAIFGGHFYPEWKAGTIALKEGASFSGNDSFNLSVIGVESHSAVPHTGVDAIVAAAHVITALQAFAARQIDIEEAFSLTVGTISGGRAGNLLAERVEMTGTVRISNEVIRDSLPGKFERVASGVCDSLGVRYELDYRLRNLPPVVCSPEEVAIMRRAAAEVLGEGNVIRMRHPRLAADTIQHWFEDVPGVFFMVGTAGDDPSTRYPSHHQRFNIAGETWPAVVAAEAMTAIRYLEWAEQNQRKHSGSGGTEA